jgi:hypothetical protein
LIQLPPPAALLAACWSVSHGVLVDVPLFESLPFVAT